MINCDTTKLPKSAVPVRHGGRCHVLLCNDEPVEVFRGSANQACQRLRDLRDEHFKNSKFKSRANYENKHVWRYVSTNIWRFKKPPKEY